MRTSSLVSTLAAGILAIYAGQTSAGDEHPLFRGTIQGAWEVVVTVRVPAADCTTAAPVTVGLNPFPSFNTFHLGGTMNESGTRASPARRGAGHGLWKRVGFYKYIYRFMFHSFDANGFLTATMDTRSDVKLATDGNTFEGVSRLALTDLSGNVQNFCATLAGSRMSL